MEMNEYKKRLQKIVSKENTLEDRLSLIFVGSGGVLAFAGGLISILFGQPLWQILIHYVASLLCLISVLVSDNWYKSTSIFLIIIGVTYFPFIYLTNAGNDGAGPIYFVMIVAFFSFYLKRNKLLFTIVFFLLFFTFVISIGYFFPDYVVPYPDEVSKYIDLVIALISVSIVIAIISNRTFKSYQKQNILTQDLLMKLEEKNNQLRELSIKDQLTNLYNRRYFNEIIEKQFEQYKKHQRPFHIMMIDLDDFKQVNDSYGHLFGDEVLRKVARQIEKSTRDYDVIARYGGEEFCVIISHLNPEDSLIIAERIRLHVENLKLRNDVKMTVSVGVTSNCLDDDITTLINRADELMYKAKSKGKNCVEFKECI